MPYLIRLDMRPHISFNQIMTVRRTVQRLTNGLFDTTIDLLLFQIALVGASLGKRRSPADVNRMFNEAFTTLEEFNHHTLRSAWNILRRKGLISVVKKELIYKPLVTEIGRQRLKQLTPSYREVRPWDRRIYLVTYDIPEDQRLKRDNFRDFLKVIGTAMLQKSVWLTPYNPSTLIKDFTTEQKISGTIIISDTGTNGSIGEESIQDLIIRVYQLEELNAQYEEFLTTFKKIAIQQGVFHYLGILEDDPQLPFELLPIWWKGEEAYKIYQSLCQRIQRKSSH